MRKLEKERGSALLVSLMVMVGLSLLGLGFVAISETESSISVNERNYVQTLQVAETGARTVAEWFNAPQWALNNGLMPANTAANGAEFKRKRSVSGYQGVYRPNDTELLFDYPFKGDEKDKLYGINEENADFVIDGSEPLGAAFLAQFNQRLFWDNDDGGEITEIRIYAPPVVNGNKAADPSSGLVAWQDGTRYGIATISVTAEKKFAGNVIARRNVKAVVAEFPFPGPEGPLQSNAGIAVGGAFRVHWGKVISLNDLFVKRNMIALPWLSAWDPIKYENGYSTSYYDPATDTKYLDELIGQQFEDPWFEARARANITSDGGVPITTPQPWSYSSINNKENVAGVAGYSGQFQNQNVDLPPWQREVIFVRPVYSIWKQIALTGATQQGIYYLRYNAGTGQWYDVRGESRTFANWVNVRAGGEEGFFFFDTATFADPQNADGTTNTAILTPAIALSSSAGNPFLMRGFIYLNCTSFGTQGIGDNLSYYNAPGEPFRDIGVHVVAGGKLQCDNPAGGSFDCASNPGTDPTLENYTNYRWDYQDLNDNGQFDYFVKEQSFSPPGTDTVGTIAAGSTYGYMIVPYQDGCVPGTDCSEPHEPYLNLTFQNVGTAAIQGSGDPRPWTVGWQKPTAQSRRPKKTTNGLSTGTLVTCTSTDVKFGGSSNENCTSNGYDQIGPMLSLGANSNSNPVLDGVLYNEGNYNSQGNAIYYGSVLIWGTVDGTGNPDVFYDYKLSTGDWQDRFENLPRTIVTSLETDQ